MVKNQTSEIEVPVIVTRSADELRAMQLLAKQFGRRDILRDSNGDSFVKVALMLERETSFVRTATIDSLNMVTTASAHIDNLERDSYVVFQVTTMRYQHAAIKHDVLNVSAIVELQDTFYIGVRGQSGKREVVALGVSGGLFFKSTTVTDVERERAMRAIESLLVRVSKLERPIDEREGLIYLNGNPVFTAYGQYLKQSGRRDRSMREFDKAISTK